MKFYCNECGWIGDVLNIYKDDDVKIYYCPDCENDMFLSEQELNNYLHYPEPTYIEPFEKTFKGEW